MLWSRYAFREYFVDRALRQTVAIGSAASASGRKAMKNRCIAAVALTIALSSSLAARADHILLGFKGSGVSGRVDLTYVPNPNTGVLPLTSPNPVDPIGSYIVTGASGTITDTNIGLTDTITGAVASNPAHPEAMNLYAPHSFGFFHVGNGMAPGFSYDNLFYPGGSPQTASDYPFHGGFLDIYGLVLTLSGGDSVNFWSNGYFGPILNYGIGITDGTSVLEYTTVFVPEPTSLALALGGFGLISMSVLRRKRLAV
jgi:hypothetical protein